MKEGLESKNTYPDVFRVYLYSLKMDYKSLLVLKILLLLIISSCSIPEKPSMYTVSKLSKPVEIDAVWNKEPWNNIPALHIDKHMGETPAHKPEVQAKMAYDQEAVYLIFQVKDQYVRCVVDEYQGPVSRDSCVEFFFTPGTDVAQGYFNLEMNCGGTGLFKFQKVAKDGQTKIPESEFEKIQRAHSLPRTVDPEVQEPLIWTVEYRLPIEILTQYYEVIPPAPGVKWKANFYKIASESSAPHWLTWSFVDNPEPKFHLPQFFGTLTFQ